MKRILALTIVLFAVSLACQTAQRIVATPVPTVTPTATVTATPPAPTGTPTPVPPTLTPTLEPITCENDDCIQACLDRIENVLASEPPQELNPPDTDDEDSDVELLKYRVDGDTLANPVIISADPDYKIYQEDTAAHERIWNYFTAILPSDERKWVTNFIIFTDGEQKRLAFVRRSNDPKKWNLGADILDSTDPILLTESLIHEFGHLLTLNTDQLTPAKYFILDGKQGTERCPQYLSQDGCTNPDSYLNQFYQRFWTKIYKEWFENVWMEGGGPKLVSGFYFHHPDQFVSIYAASGPEEDIAESFQYFVLNPHPTSNMIADQKVKFFYEFPELVALRQYTIQGLCSYVK